jgi:hypothetical protein
MRAVFMALVLVGAASAAAAQSRGGLTNDMPTPSIGLPLPHIGLPLPPMGLPPSPMGSPPDNARPFDRGRSERTNILERERIDRSGRIEQPGRFSRSDRFQRPAPIILLGWPYWPYLPQAQYPASPWPTTQTSDAFGYVYLNLHSGGDPRIFVDGYFVGQFSDYAGRLRLDAGFHTFDLRQDGYEGLRFEVNLGVDEVITYEIELRPIERAPLPSQAPVPEPPVSPPAPSTIYVIPGCYVGNVPPAQVKLPAGCDANGLITFPSR